MPAVLEMLVLRYGLMRRLDLVLHTKSNKTYKTTSTAGMMLLLVRPCSAESQIMKIDQHRT